ncbi:MAG: uroporphyrinogen decarboxylase family protein [Verrucomicrobiae bacterium]|nr:uroporphyrinogen decarboxylase family protein [Verrucomicrobiae bacterium]
MTSKQRLLAAWNGKPVDHVPLTTWCFGLKAPPHLKWTRDGIDRTFWYSLRMEHLHTLPQPWTVEDDFQRVRSWQSLGLDDVLDVSVPWSADPSTTWKDTEVPAGKMVPQYPVMIRDYQTPSGGLRHAVRKTGEDGGAGWVIQPNCVPLIEDFNIPRGVKHIVSSPSDVKAIGHLYMPPDAKARTWFAERIAKVKAFADQNGVAVQAWACFGMDAMVWLTGTEGAILLAMDEPHAFRQLLDIILKTDLARAELAASTPGVDIVSQRGWYSSTDLWSPALFNEYTFPCIKAVADTIHRHGKKFGYVMTTGVEKLGERLADAGVDVLYFVDPVQDKVRLEWVREHLASRLTVVGGTNALSVQTGWKNGLGDEIKRAIDCLAPTNRFILHPVDALFPDTPWEGVEELIKAWKQMC